ncbi:MAG: SGNH/GDSL hydrolase family protein [Flavobacteriaceae bacterium]|nr:SGNH/GDSL hydrolase family protein [Flavobacteriaceae bacterium]
MKKLSLIILVIMTACSNSSKVIFLGDSITQAGESVEGEGTYKGFITSLKENIGQEMELINKGIGGNKVPDLLLRYKNDVLELKPNIVFIYIGINDVWHKYDWGSGTDIDIYENGLRKIISEIKTTGAKIILCTPTVIGENIGEFKLVNKFKYIETTDIMNNDLDAFSDVVRNLSSEFNTELLDLRKKFKDYISKNNMENLSKGILTYDGVHLNNEGNKLIADEMIKFLN